MTEGEILGILDGVVKDQRMITVYESAIRRVERTLAAAPEELFGWEVIPMENFGPGLPGDIQSCWLFVIRPGLPADKHKHPNSCQRTFSFGGTGDLQVLHKTGWSSNRLVDRPDATTAERWVSIPEDTWHRPVVTSEWIVISLHTVKAEKVLEVSGEENLRKRKYLS